MEQILGVGFVIVWFVFWGWMLATKPDTAFKVWDKSNQNMKAAAGGAAKLGLFGLKFWKR